MSDKNVDTYETVMKSVTELVSKKKWSHLLAPLRKLTMFMHQVTIQDTLDLANYIFYSFASSTRFFPSFPGFTPSKHWQGKRWEKGRSSDPHDHLRYLFLGHNRTETSMSRGLSMDRCRNWKTSWLKKSRPPCIPAMLRPSRSTSLCWRIWMVSFSVSQRDSLETSNILPALSGKLTEAMNDTHNKTGNASSMVTELFHCLFLSDLPLSTLKPVWINQSYASS